MQFSIVRESMLKLLKSVAGVVEKRQSQNLILANVLLRASNNSLQLLASDLEVELSATHELSELQSEGQTTVAFRKLHDLTRALPDHSVMNFRLDAERLVITSNRSRFVLATLAASQFPELEVLSTADQVSSFSVGKKEFASLLSRTAFAMAEQDVRYFLNGLLLELKNSKLYAVAADGHRLAMNYLGINAEAPSLRVIVARKGVLEIMRLVDDGTGEVHVSVSNSHICVASDNSRVTSRLLEGKFPDYEKIIPRDGDKVVVGNRDQLKEAFNRAAALFSEKFRGIRLRLNSGMLEVVASSPEQDEVEEKLEIDYTGDELEVGFNVRYLLDFLSVIQSEVVRLSFSAAHKSALLEEVGEALQGAYVLMPIKT